MDLGGGDRGDRAALHDLLESLTAEEVRLVRVFTQEVVQIADPDVVAAFLKWRQDARVASLMELACQIADDDLDQLLFRAEDYYSRIIHEEGSDTRD